MPARQLQFFDPPKPLLSIFDQAFFRGVPKLPGVYIMTDQSERVIYVGQSGNLRQRLATYKNCNPNQLSRRVVRLIHQVQRISWETCDSVCAARLRENVLLRLHRPKFNVMNVYPKAYAFIGLKVQQKDLKLWLTRDAANGPGLHGAFKGAAKDAFAALVRSLWAALHQPAALEAFPCGILKMPRQFTLAAMNEDVLGEVVPLLLGYLEGGSMELLSWLGDSVPAGPDLSAFQQQMHAADLLLLKEFFERGPRRNFRLRQQNGVETPLILQEELDDYIVKSSSFVMA